MNQIESDQQADRLGDPATRGWSPVRAQILPTLKLAGPVIIAELGWMLMGVVDLVMVGRLGTDAIAGVGLGNIVFFSVTVFGIGMIMGLDALVSQAFGAGRIRECHLWMVQGCWLAMACCLPLIALLLLLVPSLTSLGLVPNVVHLADVYVRVLVLSTPLLYVYFVLRRYLQAMNVTRPALLALLASNLLNLAGNWLLIEGHAGAPRLGVVGSAWSTVISRFALFAIMAVCAFAHSKQHDTGIVHTSWKPNFARIWQLAKIGGPAGVHFQLEVGVFALAAILAGRFGASALAAHEVVLNAASVTFMVPFGIASAGAVRVGHAIGRGDAHGAGDAGWAALGLGAGFMACAGLCFLLIPSPILSIFSAEPNVVATALPLLMAAAVFQLFDGIQVVAGGVLRGSGDTKSPMVASLCSYWVIGLPVGAVLAFHFKLGVLGIWIGLCVGLICAGSYLLLCWVKRTRFWRLEGVKPLGDQAAEPEPLEAVSHTC